MPSVSRASAVAGTSRTAFGPEETTQTGVRAISARSAETSREGSAPGGVLLAVPPPRSLPREAVEAEVASAVAEAGRRGIAGPALTPFLLDAVARATGGGALGANLVLLEENAGVAARVAVAWAGRAA